MAYDHQIQCFVCDCWFRRDTPIRALQCEVDQWRCDTCTLTDDAPRLLSQPSPLGRHGHSERQPRHANLAIEEERILDALACWRARRAHDVVEHWR